MTADGRGDPPPPALPGDETEPPPILGTWGRLYALVIGWLVATILLLAALTHGCR